MLPPSLGFAWRTRDLFWSYFWWLNRAKGPPNTDVIVRLATAPGDGVTVLSAPPAAPWSETHELVLEAARSNQPVLFRVEVDEALPAPQARVPRPPAKPRWGQFR